MAESIFKFWSEMGPTDKIHPRDRSVLDRVQHGFDLRCLPGCFGGPLKTAPVVLLFLSPGFSPVDLIVAKKPEAQARIVEVRKGRSPLAGQDEHESAWRWWTGRTKVFGPWEELRHKVSTLNICGYHSAAFSDWGLLAALPSCRVTLGWAQEVLFPQAERGERVVICLRAARYWGLDKKQRYGVSLFAPAVTRGGSMLKTDEHGRVRKQIVAAVQKAVGRN